MKRSRFKEQIIGILKERQGGLSAQEFCREPRISDAAFYKWRSKYGAMEMSDDRKLKALENENRKGEEEAGGIHARCRDHKRDDQRKLQVPGRGEQP